uniref:uncharacterized protein LOC120344976 isoform X1 n=1 Tax=Styela clava TaxID=7725 RepID=UPI00193AD978|nr:uncharacterized protein LOC120344976 isoform X1 [Styela clava]
MFRSSLRKFKDMEMQSGTFDSQKKSSNSKEQQDVGRSTDEKAPLLQSVVQEKIEKVNVNAEIENQEVGSETTMDQIPDVFSEMSEDEKEPPPPSEDELKDLHKYGPLHHIVDITNPEEIDYVHLIMKLRKRFEKKVKKWELRAKLYYSTGPVISFTILLLQITQLILQPFRGDSISNETLIILQNVFTGITGVIAGLQLYLKFNEKAEKYRKGVKIYHQLLRMTSYYIIISESGGKPDYETVIEFWKDALEREIDAIPVIPAFRH